MGMGEPLLNFSNVLQAVNHITEEIGMNMSRKRITLSSAGISKMIIKLADTNPKFNLEKGIILRTFDNYKLERWNLENKEIQCEIIEVDDYQPEKLEPIIKKQSSISYRPSSKFSEIKSYFTSRYMSCR